MRRFLPIAVLLLLSVVVPASRAQYVFLDANGDGVNDSSDQLNATGTTNLDVWFVTDHNRDGTPASCTTDPTQELTINSYEIVLRVTNGKIRFGSMQNRIAFSGRPVSFADYADTTSNTLYHNGWGYRDILPPGRYLVATLPVEVLEGNPSISFRGRSPVQPTDLTSFGTKCEGVDYDNTYVLGEEFFDAAGIGTPLADAGGPYAGIVGQPIRFDGSHSSDPAGLPLQFSWSFDDGGAGDGAVVSHAFQTAGSHTARLTVTNGIRSDYEDAQITVTPPPTPHQPVARVGGPYHGIPGVPVAFDGSASMDPDGDPLDYQWRFGDGAGATGQLPAHIYAAAGDFQVTLTVSDGSLSNSAETTATIAELPPNHPPVASAGGPYEGIVGRWIQFFATGSSDPDGDFLSFVWDFGDGVHGVGVATSHAYQTPGAFAVDLTASDGALSAHAGTQATIAPALTASAFFDGKKSVVNVDDADEFVAVRFEPIDWSFFPEDVDPDRVVLRVEKLDGTTLDLDPVHAVVEQDDSDHDGVVEFVAAFPRAAFRDLLEHEAIRGRTHLQIVGGLNRGGSYVGSFDGTFVRANQFDLTVTPNPFNPVTHIIIHTKTAGAVTARLYDVHGRQVKTLLRGEPVAAGRHDVVFEARDDDGGRLASGLYFLQVVTADGTRTGRVVVAK